MKDKSLKDIFIQLGKRWLPPFIWVYFTGLYGWLAVYLISGDKNGAMAMLNPFGVFWFFPLPIVAILGIFLKRREIWVGVGIASIAFISFWGPLFLPKFHNDIEGQRSIKIMTYNALGHNEDIDQSIKVIQKANADVVVIQELNFALETGLKEIHEEYPYQLLNSHAGVVGMGVISKYPLKPIKNDLGAYWVGDPIVVEINLSGQKILLVNFHMFATNFTYPSIAEQITEFRNDQARLIADLVRASDYPVIVAGDVNDTSLSTTYKILTSEMSDAWWEAGFGFGHTFPGSDIPGSSRPRLGDWPVPQWLVRIDYIFYTEEFFAKSANLAPFDERSDHRGVIAELTLIDENLPGNSK